jgi:hypothetical protein
MLQVFGGGGGGERSAVLQSDESCVGYDSGRRPFLHTRLEFNKF